MVNPFLKRVIIIVTSTVVKSAMKAYENVIRNKKGGSGPKPDNPFNEYLGKVMQAAKITTVPMPKGEAIKILNLKDQEKIEPVEVMDNYVRLFKQNDPTQGGSFYIQSKLFCAKEELMRDFPGEEKLYYAKNNINPEEGDQGEKGAEGEKGSQEQAGQEKKEEQPKAEGSEKEKAEESQKK